MYRQTVKLTHIPTGEVVWVDNTNSRHKNTEMALKILKSRLWAFAHGIHRPNLDEVMADYEFPDDIDYPNEVLKYKNPIIKHD
jgi:peptide chain release factor 2